jgi:hypothetical protein
VKILIVTMIAVEVISWSYFSNGMTLHLYSWSCSCLYRKGDPGLPHELLLGLLLPASAPTASLSLCRRYGFTASDALLEPSTFQCGPLGSSVDRHWPLFPVGGHLSVNWDRHRLQICLRWAPALLLCNACLASGTHIFSYYTSKASCSRQ